MHLLTASFCMMQVNGCLLGKIPSLLQSSNRILGIQLIRGVVFFNHISVGMHLLSILLHCFDATLISFQLIVSAIPFLRISSYVAGCAFSSKSSRKIREKKKKANISYALKISGSKQILSVDLLALADESFWPSSWCIRSSWQHTEHIRKTKRVWD